MQVQRPTNIHVLVLMLLTEGEGHHQTTCKNHARPFKHHWDIKVEHIRASGMRLSLSLSMSTNMHSLIWQFEPASSAGIERLTFQGFSG